MRYLYYFLYIAFFRHTPDRWRPYSLFFPALRRFLVRSFVDECGKDVHVKSNADISPHIKVGDRSELGCNCLIYGGVTIGKDVLMGPDVKIITRNHNFSNPNVPIREQGDYERPVIIEDDVWIGANVVILAGVKINRGAVVAAGAVVHSEVPALAIVGGVPARIIGRRGE